ncbi:UNVERIFIED_CONTAM: hypothetical protein Scaly_1182600, partial [Sesamum calycinum]
MASSHLYKRPRLLDMRARFSLMVGQGTLDAATSPQSCNWVLGLRIMSSWALCIWELVVGLHAALLKTNCRRELLHAKKTLHDLLELRSVKESSSDGKEFLNGMFQRTRLHDTVNVLFPQVKQILLDCLREKDLVPPTNMEERGVGTWCSRYWGSLFPLHYYSRRRQLGRKSSEEHSEAPIVLVVVVTSTVTFIVAFLVFCCFRKCSGSGQGRNDESPLLSLRSSDPSIASSQKSLGLGTSMHGGKPGNGTGGNLFKESVSLSNSEIDIPLETASGPETDVVEPV